MLYHPEFISIEEENDLLREIANLEFQAFDFHGYIAKRRIVEYGFEYDFTSRQAQTARPLPGFLDPFRLRAAAWAGIRDDEIIESVSPNTRPARRLGGIAMFRSSKSSLEFRSRVVAGSGLSPIVRKANFWQYLSNRVPLTFCAERHDGNTSTAYRW